MTSLQELFAQHQAALAGGLFLQGLADLEEFSRRSRRLLKSPSVERELEDLLEAARRLKPDRPQDVAALLKQENRFRSQFGHLYEGH